MKQLITLLFVAFSFVANAQMAVLKLNDKNDWDSLSFKRGIRIWIPTWDNNGDLFFTYNSINSIHIADLKCIVLSLTTEGDYVPLGETLRFYNNLDKLDFISNAELAGTFVQQNNVGDVVINNSMYEYFDLYPAAYEDALTKAELIDRYQELLDLGVIWPIPYPTVNTPIYNGCD